LYLDTQFRNFVQGDLSVDDYCRRMKTMYDDLHDLDALTDEVKVDLNMLGALMLDRIGGEVDRADVVAVGQSDPQQGLCNS
jgi:hypothetical protein